jgi:UDP-N-acetylglucosamine acyltransferase
MMNNLPRIHPTALLSRQVELADNVTIGPHVVIEGKVVIGADCVVRSGALLCGPLTMGRGNNVYSGTVLGEKPQDLKCSDEPTGLEIGDCNTFHDHVTVHRGTGNLTITRIGSHNLFLAKSHVGHDCVIGDCCTLANGALLAGHCVIDDGVFLSDNCAVQQFTHIGRLAVLDACSITTKDIPPFVVQRNVNCVVGINVAGMRQADLSDQEIHGVCQAFDIIFHQGLPLPTAIDHLEKKLEATAAVREIITFLRHNKRGINRSSRLATQQGNWRDSP